jgi:hypothetical protein
LRHAAVQARGLARKLEKLYKLTDVDVEVMSVKIRHLGPEP